MIERKGAHHTLFMLSFKSGDPTTWTVLEESKVYIGPDAHLWSDFWSYRDFGDAARNGWHKTVEDALQVELAEAEHQAERYTARKTALARELRALHAARVAQ